MEGYCKEKEAARFLGVKLPTVRGWRRQGLLPYIQINRRIFYKYEEIERFMDKHSVEAKRPAGNLADLVGGIAKKIRKKGRGGK